MATTPANKPVYMPLLAYQNKVSCWLVFVTENTFHPLDNQMNNVWLVIKEWKTIACLCLGSWWDTAIFLGWTRKIIRNGTEKLGRGQQFCWKIFCFRFQVQLSLTPSTRTRKINLPANQKGYDNSETTIGKFSARRIQIFQVPFSMIIFWSLIFLNKWKDGPNKKGTRQIWIRLVEYSSFEVSGPSEVPRFVGKLMF